VPVAVDHRVRQLGVDLFRGAVRAHLVPPQGGSLPQNFAEEA
jgi:hypothetical protein